MTSTSLHIDRITGEDLATARGRRRRSREHHVAPGAPALDVVDVNVDGLRWDHAQGWPPGAVAVGSAAVGLDARFAGDIARERPRCARSDQPPVRARRRSRRAPSRWTPTLEFVAGSDDRRARDLGLDTGGIEVSRDADPRSARARSRTSRFGPLGRLTSSAELRLRQRHGDDRRRAGRRAASSSPGLDAALTIDLNPPGTTPRLRRVTIDELNLGAAARASCRIGFGPTSGTVEVDFGRTGARAARGRPRATASPSTNSRQRLGSSAATRSCTLDMLALDEVDVGAEIRRRLLRSPGAAAPVPGHRPADRLRPEGAQQPRRSSST